MTPSAALRHVITPHMQHPAASAGANITCSDNKCSVSVGLYHNAAYQINFCILLKLLENLDKWPWLENMVCGAALHCAECSVQSVSAGAAYKSLVLAAA